MWLLEYLKLSMWLIIILLLYKARQDSKCYKARRNQELKKTLQRYQNLRKGFRKAEKSTFHLKGTILYERNKRDLSNSLEKGMFSKN